MKRIASILCLLSSMTLAGCNVAERKPSWGVATAAEASCTCIEIPPVPEMPAEPMNLDTYRWGEPLYPRTAKSAFTTVLKDPNSKDRFMVWAFDVAEQRTLFWATGSIDGTYEKFQQQRLDDLLSIRSLMLPSFTEGGTDQYPRGPVDPGPGPGIHEPIWMSTYKAYKSAEEQVAPLPLER